jgi:hypothetical protein
MAWFNSMGMASNFFYVRGNVRVIKFNKGNVQFIIRKDALICFFRQGVRP